MDNRFDGDTVSANFIWGDDVNREVAKYLDSPKSYANVQRQFITGGATDLIDFALMNMTA